MSMKYLLTLTLVVVSVGLMAGAAAAQDSWAVVTEYDEDEEEDVRQIDLPEALAWGATYDAVVEAENDGTTTWLKDSYALLSVEGTTDTGVSVVDRWVKTSVALSADVPSGEAEAFAFTVTAPPIVGTFECDWVMGNSGVPILTDLAESDVVLHRFPDILPDSAGEWCANFVEKCSGRVPPIVLGYPDGLYRPNLTINRDAMAVYIRRGMSIPQVFPDPAEYDEEDDEWTMNNTFPDVPYYGPGDSRNHWAVGDIEALAAEEVVFGYGDGSYQPNLSVTRAQMAVFVARGAGLDYDPDDELTEDVFPDVPIGFWADNEILACVDAGIVTGYTDGFYRPSAFVDRGQMSVYAQRAFIGTTNVAVVNGGPDVTNVNPTTASYHGWSHAAQNPVYCYVLFDPDHLGTNLATGPNSLWDIRFEFYDMEIPTDPVLVAQTVDQFTAGEISAAMGVGDYFVASSDVPDTLLTGDYRMVTLVEIEGPTMVALFRTVDFNVTLPPPPPGPEGPFPACEQDDATWNTVSEDESGRAVVVSGSFLNVAESDDLYLVLRKSPNVPHSTSWADSTVAWDLCCWSVPDDWPTPLAQSLGVSIAWCDIEIPSTATEMKVTLEYRVDMGDHYCCSQNPCAEHQWYYDDETETGEPWISAPANEDAPMGWGIGMVNWSDPWDLSNWGSEADLYADFDYTYVGYTDNQFWRLKQTEETVVWTVPFASASDYVDIDGKVLLHICGGAWDYLYIDQAIIEFTIP